MTGATGFTGSAVVPILIAAGYSVRCFVRQSSNRRGLSLTGCEWAVGDVSDHDSLLAAMDGCDMLMSVTSLGFGHAPTIVGAARSSGIQRAVFVSTTAVQTTLNARSKSVRLAAEQLIVESGIPFTILRPTMIYGSSRDRNISRLVRFLWKLPVVPVVGSGLYHQQPVYVGDVARALVASLNTAATVGNTYAVAGPEPLTFNELVDTIASVIGRTVITVRLPARPVLSVLSLSESLGVKLPIRKEQVQRLQEDKVFDISPARRDFGYAPIPFGEGVQRLVSEMKSRV